MEVVSVGWHDEDIAPYGDSQYFTFFWSGLLSYMEIHKERKDILCGMKYQCESIPD